MLFSGAGRGPRGQIFQETALPAPTPARATSGDLGQPELSVTACGLDTPVPSTDLPAPQLPGQPCPRAVLCPETRGEEGGNSALNLGPALGLRRPSHKCWSRPSALPAVPPKVANMTLPEHLCPGHRGDKDTRTYPAGTPGSRYFEGRHLNKEGHWQDRTRFQGTLNEEGPLGDNRVVTGGPLPHRVQQAPPLLPTPSLHSPDGPSLKAFMGPQQPSRPGDLNPHLLRLREQGPHVGTFHASGRIGDTGPLPTLGPPSSQHAVRRGAANTDAKRQGSRQWGADTRAGRAGLPGEGALQAQIPWRDFFAQAAKPVKRTKLQALEIKPCGYLLPNAGGGHRAWGGPCGWISRWWMPVWEGARAGLLAGLQTHRGSARPQAGGRSAEACPGNAAGRPGALPWPRVGGPYVFAGQVDKRSLSPSDDTGFTRPPNLSPVKWSRPSGGWGSNKTRDHWRWPRVGQPPGLPAGSVVTQDVSGLGTVWPRAFLGRTQDRTHRPPPGQGAGLAAGLVEAWRETGLSRSVSDSRGSIRRALSHDASQTSCLLALRKAGMSGGGFDGLTSRGPVAPLASGGAIVPGTVRLTPGCQGPSRLSLREVVPVSSQPLGVHPEPGRGWGDGLPPQHAACPGHGNTSTLSFFFFRRVCQSLLPGQSPLHSLAPRNTQPPGWRSSLNPSLSQAPRRPSHPMMVHALPDTDLDAPSHPVGVTRRQGWVGSPGLPCWPDGGVLHGPPTSLPTPGVAPGPQRAAQGLALGRIRSQRVLEARRALRRLGGPEGKREVTGAGATAGRWAGLGGAPSESRNARFVSERKYSGKPALTEAGKPDVEGKQVSESRVLVRVSNSCLTRSVISRAMTQPADDQRLSCTGRCLTDEQISVIEPVRALPQELGHNRPMYEPALDLGRAGWLPEPLHFSEAKGLSVRPPYQRQVAAGQSQHKPEAICTHWSIQATQICKIFLTAPGNTRCNQSSPQFKGPPKIFITFPVFSLRALCWPGGGRVGARLGPGQRHEGGWWGEDILGGRHGVAFVLVTQKDLVWSSGSSSSLLSLPVPVTPSPQARSREQAPRTSVAALQERGWNRTAFASAEPRGAGLQARRGGSPHMRVQTLHPEGHPSQEDGSGRTSPCHLHPLHSLVSKGRWLVWLAVQGTAWPRSKGPRPGATLPGTSLEMLKEPGGPVSWGPFDGGGWSPVPSHGQALGKILPTSQDEDWQVRARRPLRSCRTWGQAAPRPGIKWGNAAQSSQITCPRAPRCLTWSSPVTPGSPGSASARFPPGRETGGDGRRRACAHLKSVLQSSLPVGSCYCTDTRALTRVHISAQESSVSAHIWALDILCWLPSLVTDDYDKGQDLEVISSPPGFRVWSAPAGLPAPPLPRQDVREPGRHHEGRAAGPRRDMEGRASSVTWPPEHCLVTLTAERGSDWTAPLPAACSGTLLGTGHHYHVWKGRAVGQPGLVPGLLQMPKSGMLASVGGPPYLQHGAHRHRTQTQNLGTRRAYCSEEWACCPPDCWCPTQSLCSLGRLGSGSCLSNMSLERSVPLTSIMLRTTGFPPGCFTLVVCPYFHPIFRAPREKVEASSPCPWPHRALGPRLVVQLLPGSLPLGHRPPATVTHPVSSGDSPASGLGPPGAQLVSGWQEPGPLPTSCSRRDEDSPSSGWGMPHRRARTPWPCSPALCPGAQMRLVFAQEPAPPSTLRAQAWAVVGKRTPPRTPRIWPCRATGTLGPGPRDLPRSYVVPPAPCFLSPGAGASSQQGGSAGRLGPESWAEGPVPAAISQAQGSPPPPADLTSPSRESCDSRVLCRGGGHVTRAGVDGPHRGPHGPAAQDGGSAKPRARLRPPPPSGTSGIHCLSRGGWATCLGRQLSGAEAHCSPSPASTFRDGQTLSSARRSLSESEVASPHSISREAQNHTVGTTRAPAGSDGPSLSSDLKVDPTVHGGTEAGDVVGGRLRDSPPPRLPGRSSEDPGWGPGAPSATDSWPRPRKHPPHCASPSDTAPIRGGGSLLCQRGCCPAQADSEVTSLGLAENSKRHPDVRASLGTGPSVQDSPPPRHSTLSGLTKRFRMLGYCFGKAACSQASTPGPGQCPGPAYGAGAVREEGSSALCQDPSKGGFPAPNHTQKTPCCGHLNLRYLWSREDAQEGPATPPTRSSTDLAAISVSRNGQSISWVETQSPGRPPAASDAASSPSPRPEEAGQPARAFGAQGTRPFGDAPASHPGRPHLVTLLGTTRPHCPTPGCVSLGKESAITILHQVWKQFWKTCCAPAPSSGDNARQGQPLLQPVQMRAGWEGALCSEASQDRLWGEQRASCSISPLGLESSVTRKQEGGEACLEPGMQKMFAKGLPRPLLAQESKPQGGTPPRAVSQGQFTVPIVGLSSGGALRLVTSFSFRPGHSSSSNRNAGGLAMLARRPPRAQPSLTGLGTLWGGLSSHGLFLKQLPCEIQTREDFLPWPGILPFEGGWWTNAFAAERSINEPLINEQAVDGTCSRVVMNKASHHLNSSEQREARRGTPAAGPSFPPVPPPPSGHPPLSSPQCLSPHLAGQHPALWGEGVAQGLRANIRILLLRPVGPFHGGRSALWGLGGPAPSQVSPCSPQGSGLCGGGGTPGCDHEAVSPRKHPNLTPPLSQASPETGARARVRVRVRVRARARARAGLALTSSPRSAFTIRGSLCSDARVSDQGGVPHDCAVQKVLGNPSTRALTQEARPLALEDTASPSPQLEMPASPSPALSPLPLHRPLPHKEPLGWLGQQPDKQTLRHPYPRAGSASSQGLHSPGRESWARTPRWRGWAASQRQRANLGREGQERRGQARPALLRGSRCRGVTLGEVRGRFDHPQRWSRWAPLPSLVAGLVSPARVASVIWTPVSTTNRTCHHEPETPGLLPSPRPRLTCPTANTERREVGSLPELSRWIDLNSQWPWPAPGADRQGPRAPAQELCVGTPQPRGGTHCCECPQPSSPPASATSHWPFLLRLQQHRRLSLEQKGTGRQRGPCPLLAGLCRAGHQMRGLEHLSANPTGLEPLLGAGRAAGRPATHRLTTHVPHLVRRTFKRSHESDSWSPRGCRSVVTARSPQRTAVLGRRNGLGALMRGTSIYGGSSLSPEHGGQQSGPEVTDLEIQPRGTFSPAFLKAVSLSWSAHQNHWQVYKMLRLVSQAWGAAWAHRFHPDDLRALPREPNAASDRAGDHGLPHPPCTRQDAGPRASPLCRALEPVWWQITSPPPSRSGGRKLKRIHQTGFQGRVAPTPLQSGAGRGPPPPSWAPGPVETPPSPTVCRVRGRLPTLPSQVAAGLPVGCAQVGPCSSQMQHTRLKQLMDECSGAGFLASPRLVRLLPGLSATTRTFCPPSLCVPYSHPIPPPSQAFQRGLLKLAFQLPWPHAEALRRETQISHQNQGCVPCHPGPHRLPGDLVPPAPPHTDPRRDLSAAALSGGELPAQEEAGVWAAACFRKARMPCSVHFRTIAGSMPTWWFYLWTWEALKDGGHVCPGADWGHRDHRQSPRAHGIVLGRGADNKPNTTERGEAGWRRGARETGWPLPCSRGARLQRPWAGLLWSGGDEAKRVLLGPPRQGHCLPASALLVNSSGPAGVINLSSLALRVSLGLSTGSRLLSSSKAGEEGKVMAGGGGGGKRKLQWQETAWNRGPGRRRGRGRAELPTSDTACGRCSEPSSHARVPVPEIPALSSAPENPASLIPPLYSANMTEHQLRTRRGPNSNNKWIECLPSRGQRRRQTNSKQPNTKRTDSVYVV
ncbi:hypothetical protein Cadr_000021572 [Camelus dromedarius]|uniref:Uncharacterized protein n=1 Tax=Camelus dromedarius TaxID=9838 RepID=A0A5N4CUH5_CAMDR|nr:hypothetical protein Cadr_000021572 [Camelus dromedarius]